MKKIMGLSYGDKNSEYNDINLYLPEKKEFDLFIYFHGGGLRNGGAGEADETAENLCKSDVAMISANYRLYPDAKYPDFLEDAAKAVRWSLDHISEYGKCKNVFIGGASAGGYIAMMLCFDERYLSKYSISPLDINGFIFIAGQPTAHFTVLKENGIDPRRLIVDETSPLYYVGVKEKYSPMIFIVSDNDMPGRLEQTMLMVRTLKSFGFCEPLVQMKIMENSTHCSYLCNAEKNPPFSEIVYTFIKNINPQ